MLALCICFLIGLINLGLIKAINNKDTRDIFERLEDVNNQIEDMKKKDERCGNFIENIFNGAMDGRFSPTVIRLFVFICVSLPFLNVIFLIGFLKDYLKRIHIKFSLTDPKKQKLMFINWSKKLKK